MCKCSLVYSNRFVKHVYSRTHARAYVHISILLTYYSQLYYRSDKSDESFVCSFSMRLAALFLVGYMAQRCWNPLLCQVVGEVGTEICSRRHHSAVDVEDPSFFPVLLGSGIHVLWCWCGFGLSSGDGADGAKWWWHCPGKLCGVVWLIVTVKSTNALGVVPWWRFRKSPPQAIMR